MIEHIKDRPGGTALAGGGIDAKEMHQDHDDEGDPTEDGAVRAVVEGRVDRHNG